MESHEELQNALGSAYKIERELGGGMSRVFLATETALGRRVALKVLPRELAGAMSHERFAREVRLSAVLQHANIVPLLTTGDANGQPYYTMPFVEGESLRDRLNQGRVSIAGAVGILRDVARALAYAHERGVVHRDIKPENILLSGDSAVVADFGVAKAVATAMAHGESSGGRTTSTITQAGTAIGTPAYMAPEQIAGDPATDHRADIYSFGCVAYELLVGASPFASRAAHTLLSAHITERPAPLLERCPECPPAIARVVSQCLEKDPAARPQSAREILTVLDAAPVAATRLERLWHARTRRQRTVAVSLAVVLALAGAGAMFYSRAAGETRVVPLAVIPFANLSGDSAQEYLTDGLSDEMATSLGKVPGVRITSRSLSYRYKGRRDLDARELGRTLSAAYVLQGSVRPVGNRLRVSVQLTNTSDNSEAWSETYERAGADAFAVQSEVVRSVIDALRQRLGLRDEALATATATRGTRSAEAYDAYLHGRFLLRRRGRFVQPAVQRFEDAIAHDSSFAAAYAAHALALELLPYFEPADVRALGVRAMASARRALELDASLPDAHTALAMAYQHLYRWADADAWYRRAIVVGPHDLEAHIQYGRFLIYTGRFEESRRIFERARAIDPYSGVAAAWYGHLLFVGGERREGLRELQRALAFEPANPPALTFAAGAYAKLGMADSVRAVTARLRRDVPAWAAVGAGALASLGESGAARDAIRALEARIDEDPLANTRLISLYIALRDSTRAMDAMERATARGEPWPTWRTLSDDSYDFMRRSARFEAIVRNVGLNVRVFSSTRGGRP